MYNFAEAPTWLRRGQILGWLQPADAKEIDQSFSFSPTFPNDATSLELIDETKVSLNTTKPEQEIKKLKTIESEQVTKIQTPAVKAIVTIDNHHQEKCGHDRLAKLRAELHLNKAAVSPEQYSTLETFLLDHAGIFALDSSELGCTQIVQHSIDTGDHSPICQPARRIPFALRNLVDEMVKDMVDQKIIQHSHSPWPALWYW